MDSCFNLVELSDMTNELPDDDFNMKQNVSCSGAVDDSQTFCVSANKISKTFPNRSKDCKVTDDPEIQNTQRGEEVDLDLNATLRYISQLLIEDDRDEKIRSYEEELALLAIERAFHDILRQDYHSSPDETLLHDTGNQMRSVDGSNNYIRSNDCGRREFIDNSSRHYVHSVKPPLESADPTSALSIESLAAKQIQKGIDEAMKFLPNIGQFLINWGSSESISGRDGSSRTKKNPSYCDLDQLVGRVPKQIVAYSDEPIRNENFDKVLLLEGQKYIEEDSMLRKIMQKKMRDNYLQNQAKASKCAVEQDKDQTMEESLDLRSLLFKCSQAISTNDHSMAIELIYKIRKHSSPNGNWSQRLAYYFVDGLEGRLAGTATEMYQKILPEKVTVQILKAFRVYLAASPYMRAIFYFTNQTIFNNISKNAQKVHIINYGVIHGFHWPSFFEYFSNWESMPPTIRITMIEVPEPGFRPGKRVELIGRRLADYAKSFNVPFEYEGIVSKWENVEVEDLKIKTDEVVIINCIVHSERLSDEAVGTNSPRDMFLNTIRKIKPRIFIHVTFNGSYNSPMFPTRFRATLSLYSSFFEMLDSNFPWDNPERLIIEKYFLMPAAFNAIAFEGQKRVERPETYRQWHARKLRAGLVPLPVDPMIKRYMKDFVREHYHKEFFIDDDNGWLLLGWKGRILYGLTTWNASEV